MVTRKTRPSDPGDDGSTPENPRAVTDWRVAAGIAPRGPEEEDEPEPQAPAERLASMLEEAASVDKAIVRVFRAGDPGKPLDWCQNYPVAEFEAGGDLGMIRDTFGPGRYSIRIYGSLNDGTKRSGLLSRVDVGIVADPAAVRAAEARAANPVGGGGDLAQLAGILQEGQRQVLEAVTRATSQPQRDPMADMMQMMTMMKLMREAMGLDNKPQSQIGEIVAAMRELREASAELSPDKEPAEPSMMQLGAQVLSMVKDRVAPPAMPQWSPEQQMHPGFPAIVPPVVPPIRVPATMRDAITPTPEERAVIASTSTYPVDKPLDIPEEIYGRVATPEGDKGPSVAQGDQASEIARVQGLFDKALALAVAGEPPESGAELLYGTDEAEGLPDEMLGAMTLENWWELLTSVPQLAEGLKPHEAWIREVRALMLQWYAEDTAQPAAAS